MARKKTTKRREAASRASRVSARSRKARRPPTEAASTRHEAEQAVAEVQLEFPFGFPFEPVHCPGCGERVVSAEGTDACPHTLYVLHSDLPEPLLVHPRLVEGMGLPEDDLPAKEQVDWFLAARPSATAIGLSITTGGMACGPVWSTLHVRFELQGVERWLGEDT